jgi:nucleoside-triphosphatase THEP1
MTSANRIAAIANREGWDSQAFLGGLATDWRAARIRVVGVLAEDSDAEGACSAAFLRDIASGRKFNIQLDIPPAETVCHLDVAGIGDACADLLPQISAADVVLLSKFGKSEAAGRGLMEAFRQTVEARKPLLTTVSLKHFDAWKKFAPDALWLEPDVQSAERWLDGARVLASSR